MILRVGIIGRLACVLQTLMVPFDISRMAEGSATLVNRTFSAWQLLNVDLNRTTLTMLDRPPLYHHTLQRVAAIPSGKTRWHENTAASLCPPVLARSWFESTSFPSLFRHCQSRTRTVSWSTKPWNEEWENMPDYKRAMAWDWMNETDMEQYEGMGLKAEDIVGTDEDIDEVLEYEYEPFEPRLSYHRGDVEIVPMPNDTANLFHALAYGVTKTGIQAIDGVSLRNTLADFYSVSPRFPIAGRELQEYIRGFNLTVQEYASVLASGTLLGGAIELPVFCHVFAVSLGLYEQDGIHLIRVADFWPPGNLQKPKGTVHVVYTGGNQYATLLPIEGAEKNWKGRWKEYVPPLDDLLRGKAEIPLDPFSDKLAKPSGLLARNIHSVPHISLSACCGVTFALFLCYHRRSAKGTDPLLLA
eukprot:gnl/MRDRNA2_/MRDRNA2_70821_c0_seq1.p1 gnl/MRDRNA2_/MRDRNA2_70821_c0~~gnl/MRDRNA2_/MRDRNA2_70821_c0_seq1.p1  ORF type:complete len:415 (-),score=33.17 gnl/MRDRNA2_/MRDRNA2_70821_c0_seq1:163-1407(-)